jgi:hypothetical protein
LKPAQPVSLLNSKVSQEAIADKKTVYALDRLPEPSEDFYRIQKRAAEELGTTLHYRQIDVRDVPQLNEIIEDLSPQQVSSKKHQRSSTRPRMQTPCSRSM